MQNGSFKLFRAFGIDVFLHWSWFVMAVFIVPRMDYFDSTLWSLLLLVSLFAIVTMHEFGHALACRSVGGQTRNIVLWPLGGIAYVNPPARPGAVLWSIVAGPLVNVALVPLTVLAFPLVGGDFAAVLDAMADGALIPAGTDLQRYCFVLMVMNFGLLVFNMIPVYPLDGGQVLMSLLWFVVGRAKALKIASILGLAAAVGLGLLALLGRDPWLLLMTGFIGLQAFNGFRLAGAMARADPRQVDERLARRHAEQSTADRIQAEVDPWR